MDIKEQLSIKSDQMIKRARMLPDINIEWQSPIEINCKNLSDAEAIKVTIDFQILEKSRNKPAVYYFLIKNKIQPPIIIDNILAYKNQRKRSCPQIEKKRSIASYYCIVEVLKGVYMVDIYNIWDLVTEILMHCNWFTGRKI